VLENQDMQRCEIDLADKDGAVIHGRLQSVTVAGFTGKGGGCILTSLINQTLDKQVALELKIAHETLELIVIKRTSLLTRANDQLVREIAERKRAEEALTVALAEIRELKDHLQDENTYLRQEVNQQYNLSDIIGQNNGLAHVFTRVEQVAPQNATCLILGETGTGKGVVARAIHARSSRKERPMITVNCTALPANLIESELFGREKGAFTGANTRQIGRFELADNSTIFLDEIGEMPMELQCKLLRVIQEGEFERLGSSRTIKVDIRIIAASNRNLEEEIRVGRFRADLFYRLNVFPITLPPLRQRKEDIPLFVNHFVAKFNKKIGKHIETVSMETLDALREYSWPGNVRELESVIERAVISSQGPTLQVVDRFDTLRQREEPTPQDVKALAAVDHDHILRVLQQTNWRIEGENGAAVILGLNPSTLRARMRKHRIFRQ
jgi:transcriptional regulator with GAF, ATPase, and Fis domain